MKLHLGKEWSNKKEKKGKRFKVGEEKTVSASKEESERDMHDRRARKV